MTRSKAPADEQIEDYISGRLSERERAQVATYLLGHPEVAAEIDVLRRQTEALRAIGQEILHEPVPERLLEVVRQRPEAKPAVKADGGKKLRSYAFLEAAAAVLLICVGAALGWFANDNLRPRPGMQDLITAELSDAYAFYGAKDYPVDFPPDRTSDFVSWIDRSFERELQPPDLEEFGYDYRGGRLLPGSGVKIGLFQFAGAQSGRLAVFFWRADEQPSEVIGLSRGENVSVRFWRGGGLSFAVVSDASRTEFEPAAEAVFTFFRNRLTSG